MVDVGDDRKVADAVLGHITKEGADPAGTLLGPLFYWKISLFRSGRKSSRTTSLRRGAPAA
jgi:hypothetical protein